jgi:hypothetical protein
VRTLEVGLALYANGTIWLAPKVVLSPLSLGNPVPDVPRGLPQTPFGVPAVQSMLDRLASLPGAVMEEPETPGGGVPTGPCGVFVRAPTLSEAIRMLLKEVVSPLS